MMSDESWNSAIHQIEVADLAKQNLHVWHVNIDGHGIEEVAFQGIGRDEAKKKLHAWLRVEPFIHLEETP